MGVPSDHFMPSRMVTSMTVPSSDTLYSDAPYGSHSSDVGPCTSSQAAPWPHTESVTSMMAFDSALTNGLSVRGPEVLESRSTPPRTASPGLAAVQASGQTNGWAAAIDMPAMTARINRYFFMLPP